MATLDDIFAGTKGSPLGWYDANTGTYHSRTQQASNPAPTQTVAAPATDTQTSQPSADVQKPMGYADMFVAMNPYRPQTAAEKEAERKRNRRNAVFAALGDGISALSNLYFTTKGAPNAYTGGSTLTGKMYERQEQLRKERQALDQQYLNAYMNALRMDEQRDQQERNWKMQLENFALQQAAAQRNAELQPHRLAEAEANARAAGIKADYAERQQQADLAAKAALEYQRKASGWKSYSGGNSGTGGKSTKKFSYYPINGDIYEIEDKYWKDNAHVSKLYAKLPKAVRYLAEGGRVDNNGFVRPPSAKDRKRPNVAQMLTAIQEYAEEKGYTPGMVQYLHDSKAGRIIERDDDDDYSQYEVETGSGTDYSQYEVK